MAGIIARSRQVRKLLRDLNHLERGIDDLRAAQGRQMNLFSREHNWNRLAAYQFKVFSRVGKDGINRKLTHYLEIANRPFIGFEVEGFTESNARFLTANDFWTGCSDDPRHTFHGSLG